MMCSRVADASSLLLQLHGSVLRTACEVQGAHFEGLASAGRALFRAQRITSKMKKTMQDLDTVCGWVRHASGPRCISVLDDLHDQLSHGVSGDEKGMRGSNLTSYNVIQTQLDLGLPPGLAGCEKGLSTPDVISYNAAISAQEVLSDDDEKSTCDSEKGSELISYSAAISASGVAEKGSGVREKDSELISYSAAISESGVAEKGSGVHEKGSELISYSAAISESGVVEKGSGVHEKGSELISYSAVISESGVAEKGSGVPELISFNAAISGDKGMTLGSGIEMGCASAGAEISYNAAISAFEKGVAKNSEISSSAAILAFEKGPGITDISYNAAISASTELVVPGSVNRVVQRGADKNPAPHIRPHSVQNFGPVHSCTPAETVPHKVEFYNMDSEDIEMIMQLTSCTKASATSALRDQCGSLDDALLLLL